jgi:hypothetical protein
MSNSSKKSKTVKRLVDSEITAKESKESAEQTTAELKKSDPEDAGRVMAKLLDKDDK